MALARVDNIGDTTTTTGTGTLNLAAVAQTGALIFAGNVTSGATVRYDIRSADNTEWEIGEGVFTDGSPDTLTRVTVYKSSNAGALVDFSAGTKNVSMVITSKDVSDIAPQNLLKNGNFINNSTSGYGSTPDDWTSSNANPVQGGIPALTKQNLIDGLGVATGDIEVLLPCNGFVNTDDIDDLSDNAYDLDSAGHVPGTSSDGLIGTALDFEASSSQYATIADASCPNLEIAGSQTWFAFIRPESIPAVAAHIISKRNASAGSMKTLELLSSGKMQFECPGLTTTTIASDVVLKAGKWYFVCFVYDSAATTLKMWVNGIKKSVSSSGSMTDTNGVFFMGARYDNGGAGVIDQYFDGLIQNAAVLSVALTDDQVKKLFAMTMYKGQKIRRATTDAYIYQDLPMNLVEQLRGKTITFAVDMAQDTSSIAKIDIVDSVADSASDVSTTLNTFEEFHATRTIAAAATSIRLRIKAVTSDGTVWAKNARLYEGSTLLPFDHSKEDWSRFPRLLQMDIPDIAANGYQYEEKRFYDVTIGFTGWSVNPTTDWARFMFSGKMGVLKIGTSGGTSNSTSSSITQPFKCNNYPSGIIVPVTDNSAGVTTACRWYSSPDSRTLTLHKDMYLGGWTGSGTKNFGLEAVLDID